MDTVSVSAQKMQGEVIWGPVNMQRSDLVQDVCKAVAAKVALDVDLIRLVLGTEVLDHKATLSSFDICDGATFNIVPVPRLPINIRIASLVMESGGFTYGQDMLDHCESNLAEWPLRTSWGSHEEHVSLDDLPGSGFAPSMEVLQEVVIRRFCLDQYTNIESLVDHPHNQFCPKTNVTLIPCVKIHQYGDPTTFREKYVTACWTGESVFNCTLACLWLAPDIRRPCFAGSCLVARAGGAQARIDILKPGDGVLTTDGSVAHVEAVWRCIVAPGTKLSMVRIGQALVTSDHPIAMPSGAWGYAGDVGHAKRMRIDCVYNLFTSPPGPVVVDGIPCATLGHPVSGCEDAFWGTHRVRDAMAMRPDWPHIVTEFHG